jgi:hypothetical protein
MGAEGTELVGAIRDCLIIPMLFRECPKTFKSDL